MELEPTRTGTLRGMSDAKFAVVVADRAEGGPPTLVVTGVSCLMHAFDYIRDEVAADRPWAMISIVRGDDIHKFVDDAQLLHYP